MTDQPDTAVARYRCAEEADAIQWTGHNTDQMRAFCGSDFDTIDPEDRGEDPDETAAVRAHPHGGWLGLKPGDWVVKHDDHFSSASDAEFRARWAPAPPAAAAVAPAADQPTDLRDRIAAALWKAAEHNIIAEWICCDPIDPRHELCVQGDATLRMARALIVDDPEAHKPAPLPDAVLAVLRFLTLRELEQLARPNTPPSRPEPKTPPADRAAVLLWAADAVALDRAATIPLHTAWSGGNRRAEDVLRRLAAEAQPGPGIDPIDDYLKFLRGQGPEPDLSGLPPQQRETVTGQFEIVKALADRDPGLPPLDRDPVARRLGLHQPAAEAQQPEPDGAGEPAELRSLPREVRRLVHAVDRMRSDWAEAPEYGPERRELWTEVHSACDAVWGRLDPDGAEAQQQPETATPASTAPLASGLPLVKGHCPACRRAALFLGNGGYPTCANPDCPEPDAATTVLEQYGNEAHPPTHSWKVESPRRDQWASWGATYDERKWAAESFASVVEVAPQRPFRLVRATTTYTVEAEHTPPAVPESAADTGEEAGRG